MHPVSIVLSVICSSIFYVLFVCVSSQFVVRVTYVFRHIPNYVLARAIFTFHFICFFLWLPSSELCYFHIWIYIVYIHHEKKKEKIYIKNNMRIAGRSPWNWTICPRGDCIKSHNRKARKDAHHFEYSMVQSLSFLTTTSYPRRKQTHHNCCSSLITWEHLLFWRALQRVVAECEPLILPVDSCDTIVQRKKKKTLPAFQYAKSLRCYSVVAFSFRVSILCYFVLLHIIIGLLLCVSLFLPLTVIYLSTSYCLLLFSASVTEHSLPYRCSFSRAFSWFLFLLL